MSVLPPAPEMSEVIHDLVSPATAAQRATKRLEARVKELVEMSIAAVPEALRAGCLGARRAALAAPREADPMARATHAMGATRWLAARGVPDAAPRGAELSAAGVSAGVLQSALGDAPPEELSRAIAWLDATMAASAALAILDVASSRLVRQLETAKARARMAPLDLHASLDDAIALVADDLGCIALERVYSSDARVVVGSAIGLGRVWSNLLGNAVEALAGEGILTVTARREGGFARVDIANDGPPIPEEVKARIFERDFTTKRHLGGSGLGLSICRAIVAEHAGVIACSSDEGRTCFTVLLPLAATEAP